MTRAQRRVHLWIWAILALVLPAIVAGALLARERVGAAAAAWEEKAEAR